MSGTRISFSNIIKSSFDLSIDHNTMPPHNRTVLHLSALPSYERCVLSARLDNSAATKWVISSKRVPWTSAPESWPAASWTKGIPSRTGRSLRIEILISLSMRTAEQGVIEGRMHATPSRPW